MRISRTAVYPAVALVLGLVIGGTTIAVAASSSSSVTVCATKQNVVRAATAKGKCPKGTKKRAVSVTGPRGAVGAAGAPGPGSVDVFATVPSTSGQVDLATLGGFVLRAHCLGSQPAIILASDASGMMRYSGTKTLNGVANSAVADGVSATQATASSSAIFSGTLTHLGTHRSIHAEVYGTVSGSTCTFTGQLTP